MISLCICHPGVADALEHRIEPTEPESIADRNHRRSKEIDESNRRVRLAASSLSGDHVGFSVWGNDNEDRYDWRTILTVTQTRDETTLVVETRYGEGKGETFDLVFQRGYHVEVAVHREVTDEKAKAWL